MPLVATSRTTRIRSPRRTALFMDRVAKRFSSLSAQNPYQNSPGGAPTKVPPDLGLCQRAPGSSPPKVVAFARRKLTPPGLHASTLGTAASGGAKARPDTRVWLGYGRPGPTLQASAGRPPPSNTRPRTAGLPRRAGPADADATGAGSHPCFSGTPRRPRAILY